MPSDLTSLFMAAQPGTPVALPAALQQFYGGDIAFPDPPAGRPHVIANFVSTLDGVASYHLPDQDTGNAISGNNGSDHRLMGLLRACADAVIWGAGTYAASRRFVATPAAIAPDLATAFAELRRNLGKPPAPLVVLITRSGDLPRDGALLTGAAQPVWIMTTAAGAARLADISAPNVTVRVLGDALAPAAILADLCAGAGVRLALHEGGPEVFGAFVAAGMIDELFLTLAPQLAGRDHASPRPAVLEGHAFLPTNAPWGHVLSIKQAESHLFLRYILPTSEAETRS